jgi:type VI secretion system protein ImpC
MVAPHVVAGTDPRRDELIAAMDRAISVQMRAVLHDPSFQALESLWRSLRQLVTELEFGETLELRLLDVTREEIADDVRSVGAELDRSAIHRAVLDRSGRDSIMIGAFRFGPDAADLELLAALGAIASQTGGVFLAEASPALCGCDSFAQTPHPRDWKPLETGAERRWSALRASPWSRWIGLAAPRVLQRLPYGRATDPTERFQFEEFADGHRHERYLWGNPAFACATLIARAFGENGWSMELDDHLELDDLPLHAFVEAGESRLQPCAEAFLGESAADAMLGRGLMPLLSRADRGTVRLVRHQSVAHPPAPLAGPWT